MKNDAPKVVKIHDVKIDQEYIQWFGEIKARYRNAQIKAAVKVNAEQLLFNWQLGRDLVTRKAEEKWGSGIVEQVSLDLQAAFPESKGFSARNLWRMKQWYSFYADSLAKLPQFVAEIKPTDYQANKKLSQVVAEIRPNDSIDQEDNDFPALFALVPWGHHVEIIAKCRTIEEALFYIVKTISGNWSRNTLMNCLKADYYHKSGGSAATKTKQKFSTHSRGYRRQWV